jgi:hypothetical protein
MFASQVERVEMRSAYPFACSGGENGCMSANEDQVTGIISLVAFSFMVQLPSEIIEFARERSLP